MTLFGTDGIRGEAGIAPLDDATVFRIGAALGRSLPSGGAAPRVVTGGDTRESTPRILAALAGGLARGGAIVENAGVVPTPAIAALVLERGFAAGVSVSASHNPWRDNGIKLFGPDGGKWPDSGEKAIEEGVSDADTVAPAAPFQAPEEDPALAEAYLEHLLRISPEPIDGMPVLLDCGHGAAFELAPRLFQRSGARVESIGNRPDGRNINAGFGALHPERAAQGVAGGDFEMGAAFDGDADRAILCDEHGRILDGDDLLWILARHERSRGRLDPPVVVGTVMSNFGLEEALAKEGIRLERAPVGDRHVARRMKVTGARLGGEPSGHVILGRLSTTGDGILTARAVAGILRSSGLPLSRLADLEKTPQVLRNVRVARRVPVDEVAALAGEVASAQARLLGRGRVLVRYSGTEPLLRIMVEGVEPALVEEIAAALEEAARRELREPA
jgi:phosphoglucosamine mutase